jgi:hypothetical protein
MARQQLARNPLGIVIILKPRYFKFMIKEKLIQSIMLIQIIQICKLAFGIGKGNQVSDKRDLVIG